MEDNKPTGTPREGELELINKYSRKSLEAADVYVFSVVLCDNEIDRDNERFTAESLDKLAELFVGKTGILDHNPTAKNQTARIISTEIIQEPGRITQAGDTYRKLTARAYIPRTAATRDNIELIDAGILKEVSVGCSMDGARCSICGKPYQTCSHQRGQTYNGTLCFVELTDPLDAYEFSFVAVPAQREAGVIKARFAIAKHDEEKRIAFGWAYQCRDKTGAQMVDHSGDIVDADVLENAAYKFVELYREGSDNHERGGIGVLVESMMFTPEKTAALGIPDRTLPTGWWVGFKVTDEAVWDKIKDGTYSMFSIEGTAQTVPV
ncbi:MAG: XkdF-like putative serine protease domain-containing protein [Ruminococcus sp.]